MYGDHIFFTDVETEAIIKNNKALSKIHEVLKIQHCFFMETSPHSFVAWHFDYPKKGPALNLLLTPEVRSHSLFTYSYFDASNLVECDYQPHRFCLYNTEIVHSILNFEKPRYLFSALFEREGINKERVKYLELDYQDKTFYLFNTQINHTIITFNETRYLFTLQFKKTKEELEYNDIKKFIESETFEI